MARYLLQLFLFFVIFSSVACTMDWQILENIEPGSTAGDLNVKTLTGIEHIHNHVDGNFSSARLWGPISMTKLNGDYYFTDLYTVRKISMTDPANPELQTIAGYPGVTGAVDGIGSEALFNTLTGITTDGSLLYVTDASNHVIRRINPLTREVVTIAGTLKISGDVDGDGTTVARINTPRGIAYYNGILYFVEGNTGLIKTLSNGNVSLFSGVRGSTGSTDGTLAAAKYKNLFDIVSAGGGVFYVSDYDNRNIRKIDTVGNAVTTVAGRASTSNLGVVDGDLTTGYFDSPSGITLVNGDLWVAEQNFNLVRKVDFSNPANPLLSTIIGSPLVSDSIEGVGTAARLHGPRGLFYDSATNEVIVISRYMSAFWKVDVATMQVKKWLEPPAATVAVATGSGGGSIVYPRGLVKDGNKLIITTKYNDIRVLDLATNSVSTLAGKAGTPGSADGSGTSARFNLPVGIVKYGDGYIVADYYNYTLRYVKLDGTVVTIAGLAGSTGSANQAALGNTARFGNLRDLLLDGNILYVSDVTRIRRVTLPADPTLMGVNSPQVETFAGTATGAVCNGLTFSQAAGMVLRTEGADKILYFADYVGNRIRRINLTTCAMTTAAGSGTAGDDEGTGTAVAAFNAPAQMVEYNGALYVANLNKSTIKKIDLSTFAVTTAFGGGSDANPDGYWKHTKLVNPQYMVADGNLLYFTESSNHRVRVADLDTGAVNLVSQRMAWGSNEAAVVFGAKDGSLNNYLPQYFGTVKVGSYYYSADMMNHVIWRTDSSGQTVLYAGALGQGASTDGTLTTARFMYPQGLETDGQNLYVANLTAHTVQKIEISTGTVTTIAGQAGIPGSQDGIGSASRITRPIELRYYKGYLYISTHSDAHVYRTRLSDNSTELFAGTGAKGSNDGARLTATFGNTYGMTAMNDVLYVGDGGNYTVRAIDLTAADTGVTTLVGQSGILGTALGEKTTAQFTYPISLENDGLSLYILDRNTSSVRKFNPLTGIVSMAIGRWAQAGTTDGSTSAALLCWPSTFKKTGSEFVISDGMGWNLRTAK